MRADVREFHDVLVQRFIDCACISCYVNAPISSEHPAKRVIAECGIEWVLPENGNALLDMSFCFYWHFPILFRETAMKKNFHRCSR